MVGTKYTTLAICGDGKIYDLGEGEFPPASPHKDGAIREKKYLVVNAYTCTIEEAEKLKNKRKKKK
jgi:hypothetical protein